MPKSKEKPKKKKKRGRPPKVSSAIKTETKKVTSKSEDLSSQPKKKRNYLYAVGRRKSAIARVRFYPKEEEDLIINQKDYRQYFSTFYLQKIVSSPLDQIGQRPKGKISIKVSGGGNRGQAESIRHGIARVLIQLNSDFRPALKKAGFLRRDQRVKERKKYGLKRARRAPQWQKR